MSFDQEKFSEITGKSHTEQAVWWLNGFWSDGGEKEAETLWTWVHLMIEIELGRPKMYGSRTQEIKEGCDLDEMKAHVFLEKLGETLTVRALRKKLSELDIDNNKKMSLSEYLLAYFKKTPKELILAPQGDSDPEKMKAAQEALKLANNSLQDALAGAEAATKAAQELKDAIAALEKEEKAFNDLKKKLEDTVADESLGVVKKNRAKNELAQLLATDPMPLRKAKLTQGAALKKAEKAKKKAEELLEKAKEAFKDAEEQLDAIKKAGGGVAQGQIWWMERELAERKKFMPKK